MELVNVGPAWAMECEKIVDVYRPGLRGYLEGLRGCLNLAGRGWGLSWLVAGKVIAMQPLYRPGLRGYPEWLRE